MRRFDRIVVAPSGSWAWCEECHAVIGRPGGGVLRLSELVEAAEGHRCGRHVSRYERRRSAVIVALDVVLATVIAVWIATR